MLSGFQPIPDIVIRNREIQPPEKLVTYNQAVHNRPFRTSMTEAFVREKWLVLMGKRVWGKPGFQDFF